MRLLGTDLGQMMDSRCVDMGDTRHRLGLAEVVLQGCAVMGATGGDVRGDALAVSRWPAFAVGVVRHGGWKARLRIIEADGFVSKDPPEE